MKVQIEEISSKKFRQELQAAGAVISPAAFLEETVEFPEGTLSMSGKTALGVPVTYYLLPDHKTLAELTEGSLGRNLYAVRGDDLRIQQVLQANGQ